MATFGNWFDAIEISENKRWAISETIHRYYVLTECYERNAKEFILTHMNSVTFRVLLLVQRLVARVRFDRESYLKDIENKTKSFGCGIECDVMISLAQTNESDLYQTSMNSEIWDATIQMNGMKPEK